ncbi:hypothetical protein [Priestia taiwanensis]|uniref:Uncharacterized protein n=1 Tax=Priestia taiwanensis TaxID=1347902 RepID=A0A917AHU5_9BACI|nr:hypothetical protein [Priestia taiwanensis]MBM7361469.1 hypothetical protein [Priestia taiwanensis]GGE54410.1 hypothetical protein GCM10007140_00910 [Priestia taiwanensis]
MNITKGITVILPAILMFTICSIMKENLLQYNDMQLKGFYFGVLLIYIPILFILQGITNAFLKLPIFIPLGVSVIAATICMLVYYNDSALPYVVFYMILYSIAYFVAKKFVKRRHE